MTTTTTTSKIYSTLESFYIKDSQGEFFTVQFNQETGLFHFEGNENYSGFSLAECIELSK